MKKETKNLINWSVLFLIAKPLNKLEKKVKK